MIARQVLGVLAALVATAVAQEPVPARATTTTTRPPRSTTSSASSGPATVTIHVGANGHVFTPNEAEAKVGDIIRFNFYPAGNNPHRVARAEFGWPCIPYEYANLEKPGFYSGIIAPQVISNDPPSYSVRVNDTAPIFFYCAAPGSCIDYHMIGVINPNATQTLAKQLEYAENATYQLMPGEAFPSETPVPTPTPGGGPPDSSPGGGGDSGGGGLSAGAIAGIAIGVAAVLILGAALVYLCGRRGGFDKAYRKSGLPASGGGGGGGAGGGHGAGAASPDMVEANYANGGAVVGSYNNPKSPGQATMASFGGHDGRSSVYAGAGGLGVGYPYPGPTPSPGPPGAVGTLPAYGFAAAGHPGHGHGGYGEGVYPGSHSSPRADQHTPFLQAPVELPSGDVPPPTQSPPPGYQGRESWAPGHEGHYRPSPKP